MAEKAILITEDNKNTIAMRFGIEDLDETEELVPGYYIVAPFGSADNHYEVVSKDVLLAQFEVGGTLENDFFEVFRT